MKRHVSCRPGYCSLPMRSAVSLVALPLIVCLASSALQAQDPDPKDWDYQIRVDKTEYARGDTVASSAGVVARAEGVQGWSFGVKHDPAVLELQSVTSDGTDVDSVFSGGFNVTSMNVESDTGATGYIQAIVLSFIEDKQVPITDYFQMTDAKYEVLAGACDGKTGTVKSPIEFTEELNAPQSPPVDLNLTVRGVTVIPEKVINTEVSVQCGEEPPPGDGLFLKFDKSDTDLVADTVSTYDLKVLFENMDEQGTTEILGWSYGITIDTAELVPLSGQPGGDSQALQGGSGPDFVNYNLDEQNESGTIFGITVGAVVELTEPGTEFLAVPAGGAKHIDTIQLRSKQIVPEGQSRTTVIGFSDGLGTDTEGGSRPVEVLATVSNGDSVVPDFSDTLTLTLLGGGAPPEKPLFIRGDSNNDARVDIADGIWIINELFYGGPATACQAAADANADAKVDLSDALYIFQYRLQPGRTSADLFPAPKDPFPDCGQAADVGFDECPVGSTTCMP